MNKFIIVLINITSLIFKQKNVYFEISYFSWLNWNNKSDSKSSQATWEDHWKKLDDGTGRFVLFYFFLFQLNIHF